MIGLARRSGGRLAGRDRETVEWIVDVPARSGSRPGSGAAMAA
jgi:hypothetical protein